MMHDYGPQKKGEDDFIAKARLHQSRYRAEVLKVGYREYGNWLRIDDAEKLLNYYDSLGVREQLRLRYPNFSSKRDGNLLRSEHIPFNLFGPLVSDHFQAKQILQTAIGIDCNSVLKVMIEYAPSPKQLYLDDNTKFDTYIEVIDMEGEITGIGIEVKYTERSSSVEKKSKEYKNAHNKKSRYWEVTSKSGCFIEGCKDELTTNKIRQIWRNHLLGLSLVENGDINNFYLVTVYPEGNNYMSKVIPKYKEYLVKSAGRFVIGCTYERIINSIDGNKEINKWKNYLWQRYIV